MWCFSEMDIVCLLETKLDLDQCNVAGFLCFVKNGTVSSM